MSNLKEIHDRIKSVGDTMKITNAMYMISSNKMMKAKREHEKTQDYFYALQAMIARIGRHVPPETNNVYLESYDHIPKEERVRGYLIITDDKGMAGAYNHNVLKLAQENIDSISAPYKLYVVGEVGRHYYHSRQEEIEESFLYTAQNPTLSRARHIADTIMEAYESRKLNEVYAVYTAVGSGMSCAPAISRVLPLDLLLSSRKNYNGTLGVRLEEFHMEPSPEALINNIVPNYIVGFIYGCLVESYCSAQMSRMSAMDNANKNAQEMIKDLQKKYNRERQALIKQEITEVASGAMALKRAKEIRTLG